MFITNRSRRDKSTRTKLFELTLTQSEPESIPNFSAKYEVPVKGAVALRKKIVKVWIVWRLQHVGVAACGGRKVWGLQSMGVANFGLIWMKLGVEVMIGEQLKSRVIFFLRSPHLPQPL